METIKITLLTGESDQRLNITLSGNPYIIRVLWNERFGYFSLSVMTADDVPILQNVKMVTGYGLIGRFKNELLPPGELAFIQERGSPKRPGYDDLDSFGLYYIY